MAALPYQRPVSEGVCSYDGAAEYPVFVIEQNYDYFHAMYEADGMLESGEMPQLNSEGKAYYLLFGALPQTRPFGVSSMGTFASLAEAKGWAQEHLSYFVRWL